MEIPDHDAEVQIGKYKVINFQTKTAASQLRKSIIPSNFHSSPADHPDVIGVGSTTIDDTLSSFSSVGPTVNSTMKPDISAPGSSVRSAYNGGPASYATLSGTSMACPHVAGVVAILLSQKPDLTPEEVKHFISAGADQETLVPTGNNCGGIPEDTFPNHAFGNGRANAKKALTTLLAKN